MSEAPLRGADAFDDPPAEVSDFPAAADPSPTPLDEDHAPTLDPAEVAELRAELGFP